MKLGSNEGYKYTVVFVPWIFPWEAGQENSEIIIKTIFTVLEYYYLLQWTQVLSKIKATPADSEIYFKTILAIAVIKCLIIIVL